MTKTKAAFPEHGPGCEPIFDGYKLKLLKERESRPEILEANLAVLGKELDLRAEVLADSELCPWPVPEDGPLGQVLTSSALMMWDYDIFKLEEISSGHGLVYLTHGIVRMFNLVDKLKLDEITLHRY